MRLPSSVITSVARAGASAREVRLGSELQCDSALGGQRCLGDQQRGHRGIGDALRHRVTDLGAPARQGSHQVAHRIVLTELHQTGDGVQLVGELVGLGPQRVGHALVRRQLALHGRQFGAVAHRGHRADPLPWLVAARRLSASTLVRVAITCLTATGRPRRTAGTSTTAGSSPTLSTRRPTASPVDLRAVLARCR